MSGEPSRLSCRVRLLARTSPKRHSPSSTAGTTELSGNNTITMQASVAKNPAAMKPGAQSVFTYRREKDLLILTQLLTPAGPSPAPITIKLTRVE